MKAILLTMLASFECLSQTCDTNTIVQTFAGSGFYGHVDGLGEQTMFNWPRAICVGPAGSLLVAEEGGRIRQVSENANVSTFFSTNYMVHGVAHHKESGTTWTAVYYPGNSYYPALVYLVKITASTNRSFSSPISPYQTPPGIFCGPDGSVYFPANNRVYRFTTGNVFEVFVGSGNQGTNDGNGLFCSFNQSSAICGGPDDSLFVLDGGAIRKITKDKTVSTYLSFSFNQYSRAMASDTNGNLYVGDGPRIIKISANKDICVLAGWVTKGYQNGYGQDSRFRLIGGAVISGSSLFVADTDDHRIRSVSHDLATEAPTRLAAMAFQGVQIFGTPGTYRIESSQNLSDWSILSTVEAASIPHLWIDTNSIAGQRKFYRAALIP